MISVAAGTKVPAATGGAVVVTGSGFGTTAADVAAGRLTATVNGMRAALDLDVRHGGSGHGPAGRAGRYGVDRAGAARAPRRRR